MKFGILECKKRRIFHRKIKFKEILFQDKSFYYIEIFRKNPDLIFNKKEIKRLKKIFIKLGLSEIIYKGEEKTTSSLRNIIEIIDGEGLFMDYMRECCEKIIKDANLSQKNTKIFIYDPFLKYGKNLIYQLSEIFPVCKVFTFREEEIKNISRDILYNSGACVLWTDYIEEIKDYKIIILCGNFRGFFIDRKVNKDSIIFIPKKQNRRSIYNIVDEIEIALPKEMEEFRRFGCDFSLMAAFTKYNFINPPKGDIISFRGYNKKYSKEDIIRILNNS